MKKWLIPLSLTATSIAAMTPTLVACNKDEQEEPSWIAWDYKENGRYINDDITPLPYDASKSPLIEGHKWISKNINNIAYEYLFGQNDIFDVVDDGDGELTIDEWNVLIKIESYNTETCTTDFTIECDQKYHASIIPLSLSQDVEMHIELTCENIVLDVMHTSQYAARWWFCSPIADSPFPMQTDQIKKEFLASDEAGNWSIKGSYSYHYSDNFEEMYEYQDNECNYSKSNLDAIFEDHDNKWQGLLMSYNLLGHPMYYLTNYNSYPVN